MLVLLTLCACGKAGHTLTATCTVCGQVNVGYCPLSSNHRETPVGLKLVCQPTED